MTRDEIIRMAREAGFARYMTDGEINWKMFERFAALVTANEREACAKVCENFEPPYYDEDDWAYMCAAAIRARGEK